MRFGALLTLLGLSACRHIPEPPRCITRCGSVGQGLECSRLQELEDLSTAAMPGLCEALQGWTVYRRVLTAHDLKECLRPDAWDPVEPGEPEGDSCYLGQTLPWDHAIWIASMGKTTALPHEYAHVLTWSTIGEATHCHWTACGINKMLKDLPGYSRDFNCWDD